MPSQRSPETSDGMGVARCGHGLSRKEMLALNETALERPAVDILTFGAVLDNYLIEVEV